MSRPTRPQARRPGGRTRPPGQVESAVLQARPATRVSAVRHIVEPPPEPAPEPAPPPERVRPLFDGGRPTARGPRDTSGRRWKGGTRVLRRMRARHWLGVLAALLVAALAVWVVFFSPLLDVRKVRLVGGERFTQAQLDEIAADELGRPLALADTGGLAAAVSDIPAVQGAKVVRAWPNTLEVRVDERVPVATVPVEGEDAGFDLVAGDGVVIEHVAEAPEELPGIDAATRDAGRDTVRAVTTVLAALSLDERGRVLEATAASPDSIQLKVEVPDLPDPDAAPAERDAAAEDASGEVPTREVTVQWGSAEESALKAEVLSALLTTEAQEYDVSAPRAPVTR